MDTRVYASAFPRRDQEGEGEAGPASQRPGPRWPPRPAPPGTSAPAAPYRLRLSRGVASPLLLPEGLICHRVYAPQALCPFAIDDEELPFAVSKGGFQNQVNSNNKPLTEQAAP